MNYSEWKVNKLKKYAETYHQSVCLEVQLLNDIK